MTDWKELARKHEESANEYARMNYKLEAINAELLEALAEERTIVEHYTQKYEDSLRKIAALEGW